MLEINNLKLKEGDRVYIIVRMLAMVKSKDIFIYTMEDFYINIMLDLYYVNRSETDFGLEISKDGEDFIKRYFDSVLPGKDKND